MTTEKKISENQLTIEEIEAIQHSWKQVEGSIELVIDFYNRLFYLHPALRPLFKEDIRTQARKFTAHLSYLIKNITNWNDLIKDVEELGKRHVSYEVQSHHYQQVEDALFYALRNHLKTSWDTPLEQAWTKFYKMVAHQMMGVHH